jgi:hypothetical protein
LTPLCRAAYRPCVTLLLTAWCALAAAPDADLAAAQRAFDDARFEDVLPALKNAMEGPLSPPELARALELKALTEAAFDNRPASVEAFRRLMALRPGYAPDSSYGPKVGACWEHARRLGPLGAAPKPSPVEATPPVRPLPPGATPTATNAQETSPPLYARWYVWGAVGVAAVAGAVVAGVVASTHPVAPAGNLGTGNLR